MPFVAWPVIADAMADAPHLLCGQVRFYVEPTEHAGWASSDCSIHLSPDIWEVDDLVWYAPQVVRHEITHLLVDEPNTPHGPLFRAALASLLNPIGLTEVYGDPFSEYPSEFWRDGVCLYGCLVSSPTVLERAQSAVGRSRTSYGFTQYWCAEFAEHILADPRYDSSLDSPAQLSYLVPHINNPQPGDLVFISFQPEHGQVHHVAFVESINSDGSVNTIEGNGPDSEYVARSVRFPSEIVSYGRP
jgi:hypothetical protein